MIFKMILGHKVAAAVSAVALGTTAVAAVDNVPFLQEEPAVVEVEAVEEPVDEEVDPVEPTELEAVEDVVEDEVIIEVADQDLADEQVVEDEVLPPENEDGEPYGDVLCDDAGNHGEYVAGVAKDDSIEGPRGRIVSQAAQTSCGKHADVDEDEEKEAELEEADELEEDHEDKDHEDNDGEPKEKSEKGKAKGKNKDA
ncbi:MAG: hypothetical protein ACR2P0_03210 [Acidimicrobiales bacterium]